MTKIEIFLDDLQTRLNAKLNPGFNKVWVDGNSKNGCVSYVLTIFSQYSYRMIFINDKNITLNIESELHTRYVDSLIERYKIYFRPE